MTAIETGMIQREIQESAYRAQVAIDSGSAVVVGVNSYTEAAQADGSLSGEVFRINADIERQQVERLRAIRARRDESACGQALSAVKAASQSRENIVPSIVSAVEAYATVGEISDAMRAVFGEYEETATV